MPAAGLSIERIAEWTALLEHSLDDPMAARNIAALVKLGVWPAQADELSALPGRDGESVQRVHLDGQQIPAALRGVVEHLVEEEVPGGAFALRRPCMSGMASTTVSIRPSATYARSSYGVGRAAVRLAAVRHVHTV